MASIMLDTICKPPKSEEALNQIDLRSNNGSSVNWGLRLLKWKRKYLIINDLVDQMQRCFGLVLLIITTSQFIRMITSSFKLMRRIRNQDWIDSGYILSLQLIEFFHFVPLIYTPYRIRQKVKSKFLTCTIQYIFLLTQILNTFRLVV